MMGSMKTREKKKVLIGFLFSRSLLQQRTHSLVLRYIITKFTCDQCEFSNSLIYLTRIKYVNFTPIHTRVQ